MADSLAATAHLTPSLARNDLVAQQQHPKRACAVTLFAIAIILFSVGLTLGSIGLAAPHNALPLWLKSTVTALGRNGCIGVIVGGYVTSTALAKLAGPIHSKELLQKEERVNPKTRFDRMFETATRVPRVILSTALDIAFLPVAAILLLIACCKSNYDSSNPKKNKIAILQIHGSGFCEIEWVASWPWLSKEAYGSVFTLNLDGLASNEHHMGVDDYARGKIRDKICEIKQLTGQNEVILMGHSMGGLVAAYYAEHCAEEDGTTVNHVISIATPWHGAPLLNCKDENEKPKRYTQMTENNDFLTALAKTALESDTTRKRTYYSIGSTTDFMVPGASSILTESQNNNRIYSWLGHYGIIAYPGTWIKIRSWLNPIYQA